MSNLQTFKCGLVCLSGSNMYSWLDKVCIKYYKMHVVDCLYFYVSLRKTNAWLMRGRWAASICHITSLFLWFLFTDKLVTPTLPTGPEPLQLAHKASLPSHRALHVIIVCLCGRRLLWGRISGDFPQVLRNMNVGSQQISLTRWCAYKLWQVCTYYVQEPLQQHSG